MAIELKAGAAEQRAVAQILSYMGDVAIEEDGRLPRGILVASEFDSRNEGRGKSGVDAHSPTVQRPVYVLGRTRLKVAAVRIFKEGRARRKLSKFTACHGVDFITDAHYSKDEWQEVVTRMEVNGADVSESEVTVLLDYLARNFGPRE